MTNYLQVNDNEPKPKSPSPRKRKVGSGEIQVLKEIIANRVKKGELDGPFKIGDISKTSRMVSSDQIASCPTIDEKRDHMLG